MWSLCLVAFWRWMREPPWQTPCFTESPCGRSVSAESICRGGSAAWCRVQPAKHHAFSSGCHTSGLPVLFPRDLLAPARNKRMNKHSAPHSLEKELRTQSLEAPSPFDNASCSISFVFLCTLVPVNRSPLVRKTAVLHFSCVKA